MPLRGCCRFLWVTHNHDFFFVFRASPCPVHRLKKTFKQWMHPWMWTREMNASRQTKVMGNNADEKNWFVLLFCWVVHCDGLRRKSNSKFGARKNPMDGLQCRVSNRFIDFNSSCLGRSHILVSFSKPTGPESKKYVYLVHPSFHLFKWIFKPNGRFIHEKRLCL